MSPVSKFNMKLISLGMLVACGLSSPLKRQSSVTHLFAFGDSYTQTGFDITGQQPSASQPQGNPAEGSDTWSGGPNYSEWLTYSLNNSPILLYNFGFGGATISDSIVPTVNPGIHTFEEQVTQYYEPQYAPGGADSTWDPATTIFSTFFGINDVILGYNTGSDFGAIIPQLITKYFQLWDNLHSTGATKFLLIGVPPVDRSPGITGDPSQNPSAMSDAINSYNAQIAAAANQWATANPNAVVAIYDFHAFMTNVLDDPASHGFQDSVCAGDGQSNCVWWATSSVHTTSHFQNIVAQDMLSQLAILGW